MSRISRFAAVFAITVVVLGAVVGFFPSLVGSVKDDAAKATIVAGVLTLLGTVFTAMYSEITSYQQEVTAANKAKRKLIFPLLQKHYAPWINAGNSLHQALVQAKSETPIRPETATRVLYITGLFYAVRLKFIVEGGGLMLLSSRQEEDQANDAYHNFENVFAWAGPDTARKVSLLQDIFFRKDTAQRPYVLDAFNEDIANDRELNAELKDDLVHMTDWLKGDQNAERALTALSSFTSSFKKSVDRLYTAWW